jgi:hypothetical protein
MTTLTLLAKASNLRQLQQVTDLLQAELGELDLEFKVLGNSVNKWVQVELSGEDEPIATNYIKQKLGTCPQTLQNITGGTILRGYLSKIDGARQQLWVDVGIFEPKAIQAVVSLPSLQAHLAEGRKVDLQKIAQTFGLQEGLPLSMKIVGLAGVEAGVLEAELSGEQLEQLDKWQRSLLDRLVILGASAGEVAAVLERTRLVRDVVEVEDLGLFEHALTCKLGTDAAGLVSKMGRYMRNARFVVYSPRFVLSFLSVTWH